LKRFIKPWHYTYFKDLKSTVTSHENMVAWNGKAVLPAFTRDARRLATPG
jgi:hypothetical protein